MQMKLLFKTCGIFQSFLIRIKMKKWGKSRFWRIWARGRVGAGVHIKNLASRGPSKFYGDLEYANIFLMWDDLKDPLGFETMQF